MIFVTVLRWNLKELLGTSNLHGVQGVASSNLVAPTNLKRDAPQKATGDAPVIFTRTSAERPPPPAPSAPGQAAWSTRAAGPAPTSPPRAPGKAQPPRTRQPHTPS